MLYTLLIVFYVLVSASLVGLILFQQGKGADAGAAFGSGSSGTVFGARGAGNFLTRSTAWLATIFFILSLALAYVVHGRSGGNSVVDRATESAPKAAIPVVPVTPPNPAPAPAMAPGTPVVPKDDAPRSTPAANPTPKSPN